jgi:hypothetical protein
VWGWWGLVLVYVLGAAAVVWAAVSWATRAQAWVAGWYRWTVCLNLLLVVYALL